MTEILCCYQNIVKAILQDNTMNNENERQPLQQPNADLNQLKKLMQQANVGFAITLAVGFVLLAIVLGLSVYSVDRVNNELRPGLQEKYTTYERLGHDECPQVDGTALVYNGFTAGFIASAGSTTFKCLPLDKEDISYYDDSLSRFENQTEIRYINKTEYRTFKEVNNKDVPCAVCSVTGRNTIQVFPATDECKDSSWTREYYGYLMTDNSATIFTCVDFNMRDFPNTPTPNSNAPTLHHVVVGPGKLQTSLLYYQPQYVLSCAVCSK